MFQYLHNRNTQHIAEYLQKASTPILGIPGANQDYQPVYALKPRVLTELRTNASATDMSTTRRRLRRLLLRLALKYDQLPSGIHISGVTCACTESIVCGGFADIFKGVYKGEVVALKRLRVFQMMEPSRKARVKKVISLVLSL